jgi:hypothetical protein
LFWPVSTKTQNYRKSYPQASARFRTQAERGFRYLEGVFRDTFALRGTPMRVEFRTGRNPYAGRGPSPRRSKAP